MDSRFKKPRRLEKQGGEKTRDRGRGENESSNDLANNDRSRLFTYATGDEVRGWWWRWLAWWV